MQKLSNQWSNLGRSRSNLVFFKASKYLVLVLVAQVYEEESCADDDAAIVTFGLIGPGVGTIGVPINFFIMACCLCPDTVDKAQEELERAMGTSVTQR